VVTNRVLSGTRGCGLGDGLGQIARGGGARAHGLGQTQIDHRTSATLALKPGRRRAAGTDQVVEPFDRAQGVLAQGGVEEDLRAAALAPEEDGTLGNPGIEHLFEAQRLGTELDAIRLVERRLGAAAFVLDDDDARRTAWAGVVEFHHVGLADQPVAIGADFESAGDPQAGAVFFAPARVVHHAVQSPALGRKPIVRPDTFQMHQRRTARAEDEVLQGGDRQELVVGEHGSGPGCLSKAFHVVGQAEQFDARGHLVFGHGDHVVVELARGLDARLLLDAHGPVRSRAWPAAGAARGSSRCRRV